MTDRRLKLTILLAGLALNGVIFLAWTQEWISVVLDDRTVLAVTGDTAAPAVSALALSGLVLIGALAIAGPFFRVVLGVLQSALGATIVLSGMLAILGPAAASASVVATATGVEGGESLVGSAALGVWPFASTISGALLVVLGVITVVTSRRWPGATRKYSAVRTEAVDEGDTVQSWDALSSGDDPTAAPPASR